MPLLRIIAISIFLRLKFGCKDKPIFSLFYKFLKKSLFESSIRKIVGLYSLNFQLFYCNYMIKIPLHRFDRMKRKKS